MTAVCSGSNPVASVEIRARGSVVLSAVLCSLTSGSGFGFRVFISWGSFAAKDYYR